MNWGHYENVPISTHTPPQTHTHAITNTPRKWKSTYQLYRELNCWLFFLQIWWNVDLSKGLRNGYGEEPIISALEKKKYNGYDNDMW